MLRWVLLMNYAGQGRNRHYARLGAQDTVGTESGFLIDSCSLYPVILSIWSIFSTKHNWKRILIMRELFSERQMAICSNVFVASFTMGVR